MIRYGMAFGAALLLISLVVMVCFVSRRDFNWLSVEAIERSWEEEYVGAFVILPAVSNANRRRVLVVILSCLGVVCSFRWFLRESLSIVSVQLHPC